MLRLLTTAAAYVHHQLCAVEAKMVPAAHNTRELYLETFKERSPTWFGGGEEVECDGECWDYSGPAECENS